MDIVELANGLRITAPSACVDLQVSGTAYRQLVDGGQSSGAGTLVVNIPSDATPLDMAQFSITVNGDSGVLFGEFSVDAGCLFQRGVSAVVTASNGARDAVDFPSDGGPWTWELELAGGCLGGTGLLVV